MYVVFHHAFYQYFSPDMDLSGLTTVQHIIYISSTFGHLAVNLFIVLSGFCLMMPVIKNDYFLKHGFINFFLRRAKRILPPYYFAIIFSLLLIWLLIGQKTGTHWDTSVPITIKDIVLHFLLINDFFSSSVYKINHVFWSIPVECRVYLFFPVLVYLWRKKGGLFTVLFTFLLSCFMFFMLLQLKKIYSGIEIQSSGVNPYIVLFAFGMLAADITFSIQKIPATLKKFPWGLLAIFLGCGAFLFSRIEAHIHITPGSFIFEITDIVYGICFASFLVACSRNATQMGSQNFLRRLFSWKPLAFTGTFAYSIYLIHAPLLQLLTQYILFPLKLPPFLSASILATGGITVLLPVCYLFFTCCEKPFLNTSGVKKQNLPW